MTRSMIALATALAVTALSANAESPNPSGQFAPRGSAAAGAPPASSALATARPAAAGYSANPWSAAYNPLSGLKSQRTRAEARADYIAKRALVHALTGEDSGSAYLAGHPAMARSSMVAGGTANLR